MEFEDHKDLYLINIFLIFLFEFVKFCWVFCSAKIPHIDIISNCKNHAIFISGESAIYMFDLLPTLLIIVVTDGIINTFESCRDCRHTFM